MKQTFVPLITYPDNNSDAVATNAVAVARLIGADIHALALNADIPPMFNAMSRFLLNVPEMMREAETLSRERGAQLLAAIIQKAAGAGVEVTTNEVSAAPTALAETAAVHARYFDLALIGWEAGNATARATAEGVLFGSGRPAMLLPETATITAFDHVAIAWDGSRVAARAVADAGLFLERASKISVLTVLDEKPLKQTAAERMTGGLVRRGLEAEMVVVGAAGRPVAAALQREALDRGCDLLVMGGYGHSRLRDFVLGGATAGVLDDLLLPVLLSH